MNDARMIKISEIFGPTIQGEGALIGQPTVFVRTGGCDYRCLWCDTMHAVASKFRADWTPMTYQDIFARVRELSGDTPLMVSLSGGNPAIQNLKPLIDLGHGQGYRFMLETQGSVVQDWFADLDVLTLSPKPPSSEMETDWDNLDECVQAALAKNDVQIEIVFKIVIFDEDDFSYFNKCLSKYSQFKFFVQPGNHQVDGDADQDALMARMRWLVERVNAEKLYQVSVLPQLHVMLWGNEKGV